MSRPSGLRTGSIECEKGIVVSLTKILGTFLADMRSAIVGWGALAVLLALYPAVAAVFDIEYLDECSLLISMVALVTALVLIRREAATIPAGDVDDPAYNMLQASISFN